MLAKHPKLFMTIIILLGAVAGLLFGCGLALAIGKTPPISKTEQNTTAIPNPAIRTVIVTINTDSKNELFVRLQNFANKWHYAILIAPTDSSSNEYIVKLYRIDMKMTGSYAANSGILELGFYKTNPKSWYPQSFFDDELVDLESLIGEISNSTYSVKK